MKIKSIINNHRNKLIELQILKSKFYKTSKTKKQLIKNSKIKLYFKKIAHIIYEYHINNKTILFVNFPTKFENNLTLRKNKTKHIFISKENWINGLITNKSTNLYFNLLQNSKSKFTNKKKIFNLIVIFNPTNHNIINETYRLSIPTITITDELFDNKKLILKQSYKILGYFKFIEEQINNNFFFSILQAILKQAVIKNKTQQHHNKNYKTISAKKRKSF